MNNFPTFTMPGQMPTGGLLGQSSVPYDPPPPMTPEQMAMLSAQTRKSANDTLYRQMMSRNLVPGRAYDPRQQVAEMRAEHRAAQPAPPQGMQSSMPPAHLMQPRRDLLPWMNAPQRPPQMNLPQMNPGGMKQPDMGMPRPDMGMQRPMPMNPAHQRRGLL